MTNESTRTQQLRVNITWGQEKFDDSFYLITDIQEKISIERSFIFDRHIFHLDEPALQTNAMKTSYRLIDTRSELEHFAKSLEQVTSIAVDLEADSMYHYKEKVCLIQMATPSDSVVIDSMRIKDMSLLKPLFSNRSIKKIMHGADYDVRSLYRDYKIKINNLFDTQIACTLLGFKETGLNAVLKQKFNVSLNKKYQRKDWSVRPLPEKMMAYAAADVIHLIPLAKMLEKELKEKNRLYWVAEESRLISKVRPALYNDQPLYLKFRGAGRLNRRQLAILEALLQFRMRKAKEKDKPLFKIIGSETLKKVALAKPASLSSLKKTKAFSPKQIEMYGNMVVEIVNDIIKLPEENLPVYPKKTAPPVQAAVPKRVKALRSWRDSKSKALKIGPGIIFNNALISIVAVKNPLNVKDLKKIKEMKNWQQKEFGKEIISLLKNVQ